MSENILQEQLDYYRARAQEYDESTQQVGRFTSETPFTDASKEFEAAANALRNLGPFGDVLELAAGTGVWTEVLAPFAKRLTVLDGSPEMLEINKAKVPGEHIGYACVNLFDWTPEQQYDLVVFGFWLSHVPPAQLSKFLDSLHEAVKPGGCIFIIDEPAGGQLLSGPNIDGQFQTRTLYDGRTFDIVKVYYEPPALQKELEAHGFEGVIATIGSYIYHLTTNRQGEPANGC